MATTPPADLLLALYRIYSACDYSFSEPAMEAESSDYSDCVFTLNNHEIRFRVAKITPTKIGQFVTLWKRSGNGPIEPYSSSNNIDFLIVSTRKGDLLGQFIFPKRVLIEKGVLSTSNTAGKRAMRVYPPWDTPESREAQQTQQWQLDYFLSIPIDQPVDLLHAKMLFQTV